MGQDIGNQTEIIIDGRKLSAKPKTTHNLPERVGEQWPKLLTKKFLANYFGCSHTNGKRFRSLVLSPEILEKAGIPKEVAYSSSTKTFNALHSMNLTKILQGLCLISFILLNYQGYSQSSTNGGSMTISGGTGTATTSQILDNKYSRDSFLRDTIPGLAVVTDSIVIMVKAQNGAYKYENVLSTIVVSALWVKEFRYLVKASDGKTDPLDASQRFYLLTGGLIDPARIIIFKQDAKK